MKRALPDIDPEACVFLNLWSRNSNNCIDMLWDETWGIKMLASEFRVDSPVFVN